MDEERENNKASRGGHLLDTKCCCKSPPVTLLYSEQSLVRDSQAKAVKIVVGMFVIFYLINRYQLYVVKPLHQTPNEHKDTNMSNHLSASLSALKYAAGIFQLVLNHQARSFAGQYALEIYLVAIRRVVTLLKFWPWFVGRYETRGGRGWSMVVWMGIEGVTLWQALTLPRVEQVTAEDEEE